MPDRDIHAALRRWPDLEGPDLPAFDAADRLLLDEAEPFLRRVSGPIAVVGDGYGAITLPLLARGFSVRAQQDSLLGERAMLANAERLGLLAERQRALTHHELGPELFAGVSVVLLRLPKSLAALEEIAQLIAAHAEPEVHVVAAGRLKYMTPAMNEVLGRSFEQVRGSLGRQKSRALHASSPRRPAPSPDFPRRRPLDELDLDVVAHGAAFAGAGLDVGTRVLLRFLPQMLDGVPSGGRAVDLGCGTGVIAAMLARSRADVDVLAVDVSSAAVASALSTAEANELADRIAVVRADGTTELAAGSVDLVVCNPPFHAGASLAPDAALRMLRDARRVLRRGGELWTVYNSRLAHARALRRLVGPTEVVADDGDFTVARTRLAPAGAGLGDVERGDR